VQFDEHTFPAILAINRSLNVRHAVREGDTPVFAGDPILPFEDSTSVEPVLSSDGDKSPPAVKDFPQNPSGRRWIYVPNVPPELVIQGAISTDNIVEGKRVRRPVCYVSTLADPKSHAMAMKCAERQMWVDAEKKEVNNMMRHEVWIKRPCRPDDAPIASTWAYCRKLGHNNQVVEYKARICAQGFRQTLGINFELKYALTGKAASLHLLLSFALNVGLQIHQVDVRSAFLTCPLKDNVTLFPPQGFDCPPGTVLELRKAIYGLKQASKVWYDRLKAFLVGINFKATVSDPCVFHCPDTTNRPATRIFAHVDDLVTISRDPLCFKTEI
jgi:hypothetical protein